MRTLAIFFLLMAALPALGQPADHVILVSVDGLRADLLADLLANDVSGDYANFQRLVDEGVSTFNARTDFTHTVTLPNHVCMMTGRPVLQPIGQPSTVHHGYTLNSDPGPTDTLHNLGNPNVPYFASVFDVAHDHGLSTALFASKSKFVLFDQSYDAVNGAPDFIDPSDGKDKIDVYFEASSGYPSNAAVMQEAFMVELAATTPDFCFVHYRDPDSAGHAAGWGSTTWNNAVRSVDGYIGEILEFVEANPVLMGGTVVIVTADHGGVGTDHSNPTDPGDFTIPYFVWGTDVPAGEDFYAMNVGHRQDPGPGRPDYNVPVAPIRNGGVGNLALDLLGLPPIPGSTINAAQDLVVTEPASAVPVTSGQDLVAVTAYPNPFNGRMALSYELGRTGMVSLAIFDVSGRMVRALETGNRSQGQHVTFWDGRDDSGRTVASGVYFYRVTTESDQVAGKLSFVQ